MQEGWEYYNHALIPTTAPHEEVIEMGSGFWKNWGGKVPLFARWTSDFDCGYETNWWYVIKDSPFGINAIKSKRRYEIRKGLKNFEIRIINAADYLEELYQVTVRAYAEYPKKYRSQINKQDFITELDAWKIYEVYGAFDTESGKLCGYAWINVFKEYINFCVLKADPEYEKLRINAAIIYTILERYNSRLGKKFYVYDGARAILHEIKFQDYLEKYFQFRKAYCHLHIRYRLWIKIAIRILYRFRRIFENTDLNIFNRINVVIKMEKILRMKE